MIPHDKENWGVFVNGPGSILAATSFDQAVKKANEINNSMAERHFNTNYIDYYPIVFANIFIWNVEKYGPHDSTKTDWSDIY